MLITHSTDKRIVGPTPETDFSLSSIASATAISPSGSGTSTILDTVFSTQTTTGIDHAFTVSANQSLVADQSFFFESLNAAIASVDQAGIVTRVSDGTAQIRVTGQTGKRLIEGPVWREGAATSYTYSSHASGSLAAHIDSVLATAISGKTPGASTQALFSGNSTRNSGFFLSAFDWTGVLAFAQYTSSDNPPHSATLISPRHVLCAAHFTPFTPLFWLDRSGALQSSYIVGFQDVDGTDLRIGILHDDISDCAYYKTLPANFREKLPLPETQVGGIFTSPYTSPPSDMAHVGIDKRAFIGDVSIGGVYTGNGAAKVPVNSTRATWFEQKYSSGCPLFLPINGDLVLINAWYARTGWDANSWVFGPCLSSHLSGINAAMAALTTTYGGGSYTLQTADLSSFNSY